MTTVSRRFAMLSSAAAAVAAGLAPRSSAAQPKFNDVTVTIATLPGSWIDRIKLELTAPMTAAGIKMNFVGGNSADFLAKLIAARGQDAPFDVVEIAQELYPDFRAGDFLAKIDLSALPNLQHVEKSLYDEYHVADWSTQPAIVYNVDKLKAAGVEPPKRFSDLATPALKGRVLGSDITAYTSYFQIVGLAYENGGNEKSLEPGFEMMKKIAPHSYSTSVATTLQLFQSGDAWAAIIPAHLAIRMFDAGLNLSVVHPTINGRKGMLATGYLGVVKNSKVPAPAAAFINAMIDTGIQERLYNEAATIPVNRIALERARTRVKLDRAGTPFLIMDPAVVAQMWTPDYAALDKRAMTRRWQRMVAE